MRLEFAKIKGAKIILHAKSSTFRAAKLKGFTVSPKNPTSRDLQEVEEPHETHPVIVNDLVCIVSQ